MDYTALVAQGGFAVTVAVLLVILRELWKSHQRKDALIAQMLPVLTEVAASQTGINKAAGDLVSTLAIVQDRQR